MARGINDCKGFRSKAFMILADTQQKVLMVLNADMLTVCALCATCNMPSAELDVYRSPLNVSCESRKKSFVHLVN